MRIAPLLYVVLLGTITGCDTETPIAKVKNMPPDVLINSPADQTEFTTNGVIDFVGTAGDSNGLESIQTISWNSLHGCSPRIGPDPTRKGRMYMEPPEP